MSLMSKKQTERQRALDALRASVQRIEVASPAGRPSLPLGIPEIDRVLPGGGLRLGRIHEIGGDEAATGFCAALLARAAGGEGHGAGDGDALLWLAQGNDLYPPGLVRYGIRAGQLRVVSGLHRATDMLWALEEALRCRALNGVVAELDRLGLTAGRRLMLAAAETTTLALALIRTGRGGRRRSGDGAAFAASRWRVTGYRDPSRNARERGVGEGAVRTAWRVQVLHCRGGRKVTRIVDWEGRAWSARPLAPQCPDNASPETANTPPRRIP